MSFTINLFRINPLGLLDKRLVGTGLVLQDESFRMNPCPVPVVTLSKALHLLGAGQSEGSLRFSE